MASDPAATENTWPPISNDELASAPLFLFGPYIDSGLPVPKPPAAADQSAVNPYPSPGRGAWRTTGGLLPAKPGSVSTTGYWRKATGGEWPVGYGWLAKKDNSHDSQCVWLGTKGIQGLLGIVQDGWFGPVSAQAARDAQAAAGIEVDGIIGRGTMKVLLSSVIRQIAVINDVPIPILGGLLVNESALDPAAVGTNGQDHGVAQINLAAHFDVRLEEAMDPEWAIHFAAEDLSMVFRTWDGKTKNGVDPWDIAIAHHNSPLLAKRWAMQGEPPVVAGRVISIEDYVKRVRAAW